MNIYKSKPMTQTIFALIVAVGLTLCPQHAIHAVLPPRPTVDQPAAVVAAEPGGHIQLTLSSAQINLADPLYTEVEWRGLADDWYGVEGWRTNATAGQVKWFVRESDFRKGPFRWRAYERQGGRLLATSAPFMLPAFRGDLVQIKF